MRGALARGIELAGAVALAWTIGVGEVHAQQAEGCTWLPDLRCGRESGRWDGFRMPIVQPYLFEDPFITTNVVPVYIWHDFPSSSAMQGGDAHIFALQARVALTDRLALIATKDGYMWLRPDNPILDDEEGYMNLGAGLKYALVSDKARHFQLAGTLRAEFSTGTEAVLAGGSGVQLLPSMSFAWEPLERFHLIGDLGGVIPTNGNQHTSQIFWHAYADYEVHRHFQPFVQLSGIYYVESGAGRRPVHLKGGAKISLSAAQDALGTGRFEGTDALNLGSRGIDNHDYVTAAVGAHIPIISNLTWSFAYEVPISSNEDITKQRVTTALVLEF